MRAPEDTEVAAWVAKAASDLRMAGFAAEKKVCLWDQVCFHSQQAAEKCLKAVLVAMDQEVPRTHDLVFLLEKIGRKESSAIKLLEKGAALGQYGVASRYPNFIAPETRQDARRALALAAFFCRWSCKLLGAEDITRLCLSPVEPRRPAKKKATSKKARTRKK